MGDGTNGVSCHIKTCNTARCVAELNMLCFEVLFASHFLQVHTCIHTVQVQLKPIGKQHAMLCLYLVVGKWSVTCVIRSETTLVDNKVNGVSIKSSAFIDLWDEDRAPLRSFL